MLKINPSTRVEKFFKNLPLKQAKQLARKLSELRINPAPHDSKKLVNCSFMRADCGEYRIIYSISKPKETLEVILIGKRNDEEVYKQPHQIANH